MYARCTAKEEDEEDEINMDQADWQDEEDEEDGGGRGGRGGPAQIQEEDEEEDGGGHRGDGQEQEEMPGEAGEEHKGEGGRGEAGEMKDLLKDFEETGDSDMESEAGEEFEREFLFRKRKHGEKERRGPPTHLYRETADQHHGGRANDLGTYVTRYLLADQASPSSATAAVERPPPIEERREDENDATSKEHGGCEPQRREVRREDEAPQREPPWGNNPRLSKGLKPRDPWRKRGGKQQKLDPCYNREEQGEGQGQGLGSGSAAMDSSLAVALWTAVLPLLQRLCRYGQQPCLRRAPPRTRVGWRGRDEVVLPPCQRLRKARGCPTAHPAA